MRSAPARVEQSGIEVGMNIPASLRRLSLTEARLVVLTLVVVVVVALIFLLFGQFSNGALGGEEESAD